MRNALRDAPAIVIVAKSDGGGVAQIGGVECGADFVQRDPLPGELDIGLSSLFADSGNFHEFPSGHGKFERRSIRLFHGDEGTNGVYARGSEQDVPAGRRREAGGTARRSSGNPSMMLEDESFGGDVGLVGDDADLQGELLLRAESGRGRDKVGREPAGEEVARRTACETAALLLRTVAIACDAGATCSRCALAGRTNAPVLTRFVCAVLTRFVNDL